MSFPDLNRRSFKLLGILYFTLITLSYMIFWSRDEPYMRPWIFFVTLAISGVAILIQIWGAKSALQRFIVFNEVILLSLTFTLTQQLLYQSPLSRDPWTHWALVSQILRNGHIPLYESIKTPYVYLPNFHLIISIYMLVGSVPYKWASYSVIGMLTLILLGIVIYLFTRIIVKGTETSLMAILLLVTADNVLDMTGKNIVPNSLGVALALVIFYLVWRYYPEHKKITFVAYMLLIGLAFMHTLSYGMLIQQLTILLFLFVIIQDKSGSFSVARLLLISLIMAMFVWGIWSHVYFKSLVLMLESLLKGIEPSEYAGKLSVPIKYVILARLGMIVYYAITGFTSLCILINQVRKRNIQRGPILIPLAVLFFGGMGVFAFLNPGWAGIAHRYWYYGEIIGGVIFGNLLFYVIKKYKYGGVFSSIVVFILILLMFGATVSNDDNPLIKEYSTRTGWYDSEITAGLFAIKKIQGSVASDWDCIMNLNNLKWVFDTHPPLNPPKYGDIGWVLNSKFPRSFSEIFSENGYIFILRKELIENYAFWLGPRWGMIQYTPLHDKTVQIIKTGSAIKDIIYSSNSTVIWYG